MRGFRAKNRGLVIVQPIGKPRVLVRPYPLEKQGYEHTEDHVSAERLKTCQDANQPCQRVRGVGREVTIPQRRQRDRAKIGIMIPGWRLTSIVGDGRSIPAEGYTGINE